MNDDFSKYMNEPVKCEIRDEIIKHEEDIAYAIKSGYSVAIRPTKDGIKVTKYKEKRI